MSAPSGNPVRPGERPEGRSLTKVIPLEIRKPSILVDFQPDALAIEERPPHLITRVTLYAVAMLIAAAVGWAAISEVDRVVVAPGRLVTSAPNLVVQPLETSVIRNIAVRPGDVVQAGSTLATLDPTFSTADVAQLSERLANRAAQVARLEAELDGRDYATTGASEDERLQTLNFNQRAAYRRARIQDFDERAARIEASLAKNRRDMQMLGPRLDVLRELESMRVQLVAGQIGSRVHLLETRNTRMELEGRFENLRLGLAELDHELQRARAERQTFIEEYRQTAIDELVKLRTERDGFAEDLNKATLRRQMVALTAPVDAVVLEVGNRSVGSVVREAETLFTLVPLSVPLEAELAVEARDIGRIAVGHPVRVKLDAFPYQEHGTASGFLRTISEGAFAKDRDREQEQEHSRDAIYRARLLLTDTELRGVPDTFRLIPGMTVVGEIKVGRRNVLSYFLYPLLRGLDESLHEP